MAGYIGQVKIGEEVHPIGSLLYGTCETAAGDSPKTVTLPAFQSIADGITIHVKFLNSNTAQDPTLQVGTEVSAKPIMVNGTTHVGQTEATSWRAGAVVTFTYDGTNWVMNTGVDNNDNTTYSSGTGINIDSNNQINHSNSINAQSTQGVYPITVDAQGHIASMGSKVTLGAAAAKGVDTTLAANSTSTNLPTSKAVATLVSNATAGLTGAMHFIGISTTVITDGGTENPTINNTTVTTKSNGDVVIYNNGTSIGQEYVWSGSAWELLGDEGSYKVKQSIVNDPTADGDATSFIDTISQDENGVITVTKKNVKDYILKSVGTAKGDLLYWTAKSTVSRLAIGTNNKILASNGSAPVWKTASVSVTENTSGTIIKDIGALQGGVLPTFTPGTLANASVTNGTLTLINPTQDSFTQGSFPTQGSITKANLGISLS